jgi:hypothetical protein
MGKFDGVLLASDFDNTLIYTEVCLHSGEPIPPLSEKNRAALTYFMAEGGRFAVATGRALAAFAPVAPMIPVNAPSVICNGAAIYDWARQEYIEFLLLDEAARDRAQAVLDAFPTVAVEAYHIDNVIHSVHPNAITRLHEHLTHVDTEERPTMADVPLPLGKLLFEEERPVLEQVAAFMRQKGWAEDYELIHSAANLLEVTKRGADKGGMVLRLAERLGIDQKHIYCVGDEANDISMLTAAARGFAPANCTAAVRGCGATVVSDAEHSALADVVAILDRMY